jgi:hypothetical protein
MLGKARRLIIPKITKAIHFGKINAYKNKYASKLSKLSYKCSLVPNYPRNAASISRTTTDLALLIYKGNQSYIKNKYL